MRNTCSRNKPNSDSGTMIKAKKSCPTLVSDPSLPRDTFAKLFGLN